MVKRKKMVALLLPLLLLGLLYLSIRSVRANSVYDYEIVDVTQTGPDTIVVSAQCKFCYACNPNNPTSGDYGDGCDPFEPGDPNVLGSGYHDCGMGSPDGRFAAVRLVSSMGAFDTTQKLICDTSNWPLNTLWAHNFVFTGLTLDPADTITAYADFYCSYCYHWYSEPEVVIPEPPGAGQASIDYKTTNAAMFNFGDVVTVTTEVNTTLTSQDVIVDTSLIDPASVVQDYTSWTGTITPGPDPITQYLNIPSSGISGTWIVFVTVLNSTGNFQDSERNLITVGVITIESCDSTGATQDTFNPAEDMYVIGSGYSPSTTYDIYMVEDVTTWTDQMSIPPRVSGTATSVSSDSGGNIPVTLGWSLPLVPGKYDIVVDVDGDGVYDEGTDALDDNDIQVTAGFFVIPEYWLGTILGLAGCFAAFAVFSRSKRLHQIKTS